jgi:hypothetical protein
LGDEEKTRCLALDRNARGRAIGPGIMLGIEGRQSVAELLEMDGLAVQRHVFGTYAVAACFSSASEVVELF